MIDHLVLLTTTRCNLRCLHCLRGYDQPPEDFPLGMLPSLLPEARLFGARHVALTGGEPGLHPAFPDLVEQIVSAGYTWHFVSNGLRSDLYLPVIDRFRDSLTAVALSLDGADAETHNQVRGHPRSFELMKQAATHYRQRDIPLRLAVTFNRLNRDQLPDLLKLGEEMGVKTINLAAIIPTEWNKALALSEPERIALYNQSQELRSTTSLNIRTLSSLHTSGGVNFCPDLNLREVTFNARAEMMFCCDLADTRNGVGSLREQSLQELLQLWLDTSARLQKARVAAIASYQMPDGFDGCAFCNEFIARQIRGSTG